MSRIEEALKRAGAAPAVEGAAGRDDTFVSSWETTPTAAPAAGPSTAPKPPATAVLNSRLLVSASGPKLSWSSGWRERCVTAPEADPVLVEQYRRLAAVLHNAQASNGLRILMIASADQADGKTSTALNLSLVLSESYHRRVLLVDADLRRPSLGGLLELADVPGLGDALKAPVEQKLSLIEMTPNFTLLPGGRPDPDPIRGLTSPRMRQILDEAAERFDWVILDAPPLGPAADAQFLAEMVDGVVFVIRAGDTQYSHVEKAIGTIGRDRVLGVVLNGVDRMPDAAYGYPYRYAPPGPK